MKRCVAAGLLGLSYHLLPARVLAQESAAPTPKGTIGAPEVRLPGEQIGRRALLNAEREGVMEEHPLSPGGSSVDILSDTQGVNFAPYLRVLLHKIYATWLPLIPAEARPPRNVPGTTLIRFKIGPTGRLMAMTLDGSSHNDAINRAAWGSIAGAGPFERLPEAFTGPYLELRIRFLVNQAPKAATATPAAIP